MTPHVLRIKLDRRLFGDRSRVSAKKSNVDVGELEKLYSEVSERFGSLTKSFEELVAFHNRMVDEKVRYIAKDIHPLEVQITATKNELHTLSQAEEESIVEITETGTLEEIEAIVVALN